MTNPNPPEAESGAPDHVEIRFPSRSEYLSLLRQVVEWFAERCGFEDKAKARIVLSVVEATTNIMRHAYGGDPDQMITLSIRRVDGCLELEFLDRGRSAEPGELEKGKTESLEPGGLGVRMIRTCMDGFSYETRPGGGSRLILRKQLGDDGRSEGPDAPSDEGTDRKEMP